MHTANTPPDIANGGRHPDLISNGNIRFPTNAPHLPNTIDIEIMNVLKINVR